jgi:hypothetical protein
MCGSGLEKEVVWMVVVSETNKSVKQINQFHVILHLKSDRTLKKRLIVG